MFWIFSCVSCDSSNIPDNTFRSVERASRRYSRYKHTCLFAASNGNGVRHLHCIKSCYKLTSQKSDAPLLLKSGNSTVILLSVSIDILDCITWCVVLIFVEDQVQQWINKYGWKLQEDGNVFIVNQEENIKTKNITETITFESECVGHYKAIH